ncbi:MAG TPA: SRPBCC domain-containing protein [Thermoanaerobaculia bacterium]|nr:SRPBCC domain-containing protein [Thermoanaerobaculia bacterium]
MTRSLRKEVWLARPPEDVWLALTDPKALAEWLMPNNFEPRVGHTFRFHVDPMPGFSGISECRVLEVLEPSRLVYTWTVLPKAPDAPRPPSMTVAWRLEPERGGTRLVLEQTGLEVLNRWWRFSMAMGWNRMMKKLLPKVLERIADGRFTPGAVARRDYGTKTVPDGYAK